MRAYRPTDKASVMRLFELNCPKFFSPEERADFSNYLENEIEFYYVAEFEGEILGAGGINYAIELDGDACLSWGMVHPDHQGKGLGTALTQHRIEVVFNENPHCKLMVRTAQFTYKFYEKMGFELKTIIQNQWAEGYHGYVMELKSR